MANEMKQRQPAKTLGQIAYEAHEMERMLTLYRWKRQRYNTPWKNLGKRRKNEWENIADAVAAESYRRIQETEKQQSDVMAELDNVEYHQGGY